VAERPLGQFFKHTTVYTVGNLVYSGASFLLIPLYVHVLTPAEYGTLEMYYVTAAILQTLLASGIAHSALRFYFEYDRQEDRNASVSTAVIASLIATSLGACVLWTLAPTFSRLLFGSTDHTLAFRIVSSGIVFEISREVSLAFVRARERSSFFVLIAILQLVVQVTANVTTVVVLRLGVVGILVGNLTATFVTWIPLTISTLRACGLRFDLKKLVPILQYGAPLMLAAVAGTLLGSSDRYLLNARASLGAVGLYALALRFASVPASFLVDPLAKSFGPFRFAIMTQPDAPQTYSRILRYYVYAAGVAFVGISAFCDEAVRVLSSQSYQRASSVVPLVILPTLLGGILYFFQTGIYVSKRSKHILYITVATGLANLGLNFALIPRFGIYGAAASATLASLVAVALTYGLAQAEFPIRWSFKGIPKILFATALAGAAVLLIPRDPLVVSIPIRAAVLLGFAAYAIPRAPGQSFNDVRVQLTTLLTRRA